MKLVKDYPTSMTELCKLLNKKRIKHILRPHPMFIERKAVMDILGYSPVGEWQVIIEGNYSVIRGMCSFGYYEIMNIGKGKKYDDPERFETPGDLLKDLTEQTKEERMDIKIMTKTIIIVAVTVTIVVLFLIILGV